MPLVFETDKSDSTVLYTALKRGRLERAILLMEYGFILEKGASRYYIGFESEEAPLAVEMATRLREKGVDVRIFIKD